MPQLLVAPFELLYVKKCQEVRSEADQELTVRAIPTFYQPGTAGCRLVSPEIGCPALVGCWTDRPGSLWDPLQPLAFGYRYNTWFFPFKSHHPTAQMHRVALGQL